jgi:hypothetical protein
MQLRITQPFVLPEDLMQLESHLMVLSFQQFHWSPLIRHFDPVFSLSFSVYSNFFLPALEING